jgi:hypothetical protein
VKTFLVRRIHNIKKEMKKKRTPGANNPKQGHNICKQKTGEEKLGKEP